jgi:hypothetical protein
VATWPPPAALRAPRPGGAPAPLEANWGPNKTRCTCKYPYCRPYHFGIIRETNKLLLISIFLRAHNTVHAPCTVRQYDTCTCTTAPQQKKTRKMRPDLPHNTDHPSPGRPSRIYLGAKKDASHTDPPPPRPRPPPPPPPPDPLTPRTPGLGARPLELLQRHAQLWRRALGLLRGDEHEHRRLLTAREPKPPGAAVPHQCEV